MSNPFTTVFIEYHKLETKDETSDWVEMHAEHILEALQIAELAYREIHKDKQPELVYDIKTDTQSIKKEAAEFDWSKSSSPEPVIPKIDPVTENCSCGLSVDHDGSNIGKEMAMKCLKDACKC